jgi:hypothetical protein
VSTASDQATAAPRTAAPPAASLPGAQLLSRFPPRAVAPSWPATQAGRSQVLTRLLAPPFALEHSLSQQSRRLGLLSVVNWLQTQPGDSWQDRWLASGAQDHGDWRELVASPSAGRAAITEVNPRKLSPHLSPGLMVLICADVIRPSIEWLLACPAARRGLATEMARTRDPVVFAQLAARLSQGTAVGTQSAQQALTRIAVIMAAKGGLVGQVSVGDAVELLEVAARVSAKRGTGTPTARCSTSCCMLTASGARTHHRRSRCSPDPASPAVSS